MNSQELLEQIAQEIAQCTKCDLHYSRKNAVPGEGPANAEIMLIGEGPGFHENQQGKPFVGAAGKFLDELLASIQLKRTDVFITNVVKCRPPSNRDPLPLELKACNDFLECQIQALNPKVIVTLGRFSMARFLPNAKISQAHGKAMTVKGRLVVAMYHPAAALHQPSLRPTVEADFAKLPQLMANTKPPSKVEEQKENYQTEQEDPKQLSLF